MNEDAQTPDEDSRTRDAAERARMLEEVRAGLGQRPRNLPSKYFYDERGSRLFEEITRLPEYYLTGAERRLLENCVPGLVRRLRPRTLVELGAGSAAKTRRILDAMTAAGVAELYIPVDVSAAFLEETAARLRREYEGLKVRPVVADITESLTLPDERPSPALFAFLGSTLGNFERAGAVALLHRMRGAMMQEDRLLLGVDLRKAPERIEAAYNDARGLTAEFNRNILRVLNRRLGADFEPGAFRHRAFYDTDRHRIEMQLVSRREQTVNIPGIGELRFRRDEPIRTEISCKYDRDTLDGVFDAAGLEMDEWAPDPDGLFALALARRDDG